MVTNGVRGNIGANGTYDNGANGVNNANGNNGDNGFAWGPHSKMRRESQAVLGNNGVNGENNSDGDSGNIVSNDDPLETMLIYWL